MDLKIHKGTKCHNVIMKSFSVFNFLGRIGIVDYDSVEVDNLHRQILHTEQTIGQHKSDSMASGIHR